MCVVALVEAAFRAQKTSAKVVYLNEADAKMVYVRKTTHACNKKCAQGSILLGITSLHAFQPERNEASWGRLMNTDSPVSCS